MKQYIMGMITEASLILCAVMFIGASDNNSNYGKYEFLRADNGIFYLLETATGKVYKSKGINTEGDHIWNEAYIKVLFKPWD